MAIGLVLILALSTGRKQVEKEWLAMPPPFSLAKFNQGGNRQEVANALRKINRGIVDLSLLAPRDQRKVLLLAVKCSGLREPDAGILDYINVVRGRPPKLHAGPGNSFDDYARSKDGRTVVFTGYDETDHTGWPTWGPVPIGPAGRAIRKMIEKGVFDLRRDYYSPRGFFDGRPILNRIASPSEVYRVSGEPWMLKPKVLETNEAIKEFTALPAKQQRRTLDAFLDDCETAFPRWRKHGYPKDYFRLDLGKLDLLAVAEGRSLLIYFSGTVGFIGSAKKLPGIVFIPGKQPPDSGPQGLAAVLEEHWIPALRQKVDSGYFDWPPGGHRPRKRS